MKEYKLKEKLVNKFFKYVSIPSQSCSYNSNVPSSEGQWTLANVLMDELKDLGFVDVQISNHCVVTGHLPARLSENHKPVKKVGWCCHLDTVDVSLSDIIHPEIVKNYDGKDICQNEEKQIFIHTDEHPELLKYIGDDIIISDGTSVLGADNKSAIANVMTSFEILKENPEIEHGEIYVAFTPDEEIGLLGAKSMEIERFPVDFAYTIDCTGDGDLVTQTFNAGSAILTIKGISAHPMSSKNNLVNPIMVAHDFISLLDRFEMPEHTENTEGFIWPSSIQSDVINCTVKFTIRDHNKQKYLDKKEFLQKALEITKLKHPKAELSIEFSDTYGNIADALNESNSECISLMYKALEELNIPSSTIAMRGGTDGSYISTKGIPTPNYFTGAYNFHASCEFLPLSAFERSCLVTLKLIELITKG